jgi:hypothetical protein
MALSNGNPMTAAVTKVHQRTPTTLPEAHVSGLFIVLIPDTRHQNWG